jgi:predicted CoA-binding protein
MDAPAVTDHDTYDDEYLRGILNGVKTIVMVGASDNWNRPSFFAMKYLQKKGYRIIPVNPRAVGTEILGEKVVGDLKDVPGPIDMVDIFRNSEAAGQITDEAVALAKEKNIKVIWMQITVRNDAAAKRAEDAGLKVVMNRCPKIEYARLNGELSWNGINSQVISSKRRRI